MNVDNKCGLALNHILSKVDNKCGLVDLRINYQIQSIIDPSISHQFIINVKVQVIYYLVVNNYLLQIKTINNISSSV